MKFIQILQLWYIYFFFSLHYSKKDVKKYYNFNTIQSTYNLDFDTFQVILFVSRFSYNENLNKKNKHTVLCLFHYY